MEKNFTEIEQLKKEKILLTGITGFVGANLAHTLLDAGIQVYAIKRKKSNLWRLKGIAHKIKFYDADLNNRELVQDILKDIDPAIVIHLAIYGGYPYQQDVRNIFESNLFGTINILGAFLQMGLKICRCVKQIFWSRLMIMAYQRPQLQCIAKKNQK